MVSWSLASSVDKEYIFDLAREMGWFESPQKVQVKRYIGMEVWYVIEPYEKDCQCPSLILPEEGKQYLELDDDDKLYLMGRNTPDKE